MSFSRAIGIALAAIGSGGVAALSYALLRDTTSPDDDTGETLPPSAPPPVAQAEAKTLGARAVENLTYWLGAHGNGPKGSAGYHRGDFIDKVMRGYYNDEGDKLLGLAWCSRAARYAYDEAAHDLGMSPPFSKLGALSMAEAWKKAPFNKYALSSAKVGAVWVIKTAVGYHTGLVAKVLGPLQVITIEGNHGDAVASVKRTFDLSKDALTDVEAWVLDQQKPALVGYGLNLFAVE